MKLKAFLQAEITVRLHQFMPQTPRAQQPSRIETSMPRRFVEEVDDEPDYTCRKPGCGNKAPTKEWTATWICHACAAREPVAHVGMDTTHAQQSAARRAAAKESVAQKQDAQQAQRQVEEAQRKQARSEARAERCRTTGLEAASNPLQAVPTKPHTGASKRTGFNRGAGFSTTHS